VSRSLDPESLRELSATVEEGLREHAAAYPGDPGTRQPVHTVYVPADRFRPTTVGAYGGEALRLLEAHAPDDASFAEAFELPAELAANVRPRVVEKLRAEPIEDLSSTSRTATARAPMRKRTATPSGRRRPWPSCCGQAMVRRSWGCG